MRDGVAVFFLVEGVLRALVELFTRTRGPGLGVFSCLAGIGLRGNCGETLSVLGESAGSVAPRATCGAGCFAFTLVGGPCAEALFAIARGCGDGLGVPRPLELADPFSASDAADASGERRGAWFVYEYEYVASSPLSSLALEESGLRPPP